MNASVFQLPLWRQLQAVVGVLQAIRQGQSGTAAIEAVATPLRPGVQALSFAVLRSLGRAEAIRKLLAPRSPQRQRTHCCALRWRYSGSQMTLLTMTSPWLTKR